ncbi:HK97-gp10 family putative phage morphogenesis protein [Pseudovibrio sp. Ad13]|uniref:HK97-gp10 family putative phage morphogenesis protein n=1 Tax=Pseudovibrio sp. Ad13 TaxID=989396 RepID=UPI000B0EF952|nr:HK97-gp10 family putative phage morphogenesis protein [Pseudovibrio sp. Ad13]
MVKGEQEFRQFMRKILPDAVKNAARQAMEEGAERIVQYMRLLVPKDEGALLASIGWTWGKPPEGAMVVGKVKSSERGLRIVIYAGNASTMVTNKRGIKFQNALIQEFGTKDRKSHPFFYPVYRSQRRAVKSLITRRINKAIKVLNDG